MQGLKPIFPAAVAFCLAGCSLLYDSATSVAADIESGVGRLGRQEGAVHVITHDSNARAGGDVRTVTVQFDNGSVRSFDYAQPPNVQIGDRVRADGDQLYR